MPAETKSNSINLLCNDGGLCATFTPALTDSQYAALREAIRHEGATLADLALLLRKLGRSWNCKVAIDPC
jgi:hypothetical protein